MLISSRVIACCAEDKNSLTEKLFHKNQGTIFIGKVLSTEMNDNEDYYSMVEVVELLFGQVDSSIVMLRTGNPNASTGYSTLAVEQEYIVYTYGKGSRFGCCGICDNWTKSNSNSKSVLTELETLRKFSDIIHNKKSGFFEFYHPNGKTAANGKYKNGVPVGVWEHYYNTGIKKSEFDFKNGINKTYRQNGFIETESIAERKKSTYLKYSSEVNGLIQSKFITTKNDTGSVMQTHEYYKNGNLKRISGQINVNVKGGSTTAGKTGIYEEYYENGHLKLRGQFERNRRTGVWRWYYENGDYNTEYDYGDGSGPQ